MPTTIEPTRNPGPLERLTLQRIAQLAGVPETISLAELLVYIRTADETDRGLVARDLECDKAESWAVERRIVELVEQARIDDAKLAELTQYSTAASRNAAAAGAAPSDDELAAMPIGRLTHAFATNAALQAEFGDAGGFVAYCRRELFGADRVRERAQRGRGQFVATVLRRVVAAAAAGDRSGVDRWWNNADALREEFGSREALDGYVAACVDGRARGYETIVATARQQGASPAVSAAPTPPPAQSVTLLRAEPGALVHTLCERGELPAMKGAPGEILVFPAGTFAANGRTYRIDAAAAASLIARFEADAVDLVIDYEHQSVGLLDGRDFRSPDGTAPAAGWITGLRWQEGRGLVASVKWTERAQRLLSTGEYRYYSPGFSFDAGGTVRVLNSVALTNTPAMRPISPLAAKQNMTRVGA